MAIFFYFENEVEKASLGYHMATEWPMQAGP
jgi:hypothetical protein